MELKDKIDAQKASLAATIAKADALKGSSEDSNDVKIATTVLAALDKLPKYVTLKEYKETVSNHEEAMLEITKELVYLRGLVEGNKDDAGK